MRSRYGCLRTRSSSSPTSWACRPSARSASILSSVAARRRSSRRVISCCANASPATSASGEPRQSASASRNVAAATDGGCSRASETSRSKQWRSMSSGATSNLYPRGSVAITPSPSTLRSRETYTCRDFCAVRSPSPELLDQRVRGDDLPCVEHEKCQKGALVALADRQRLSVAGHLDRSQDPEVHASPPNSCVYRAVYRCVTVPATARGQRDRTVCTGGP